MNASATEGRPPHRVALGAVIAVLVSLATVLAGGATAHAAWNVEQFEANTYRADGSDDTQAGSHPATARTFFLTSTDADGFPAERMREVRISLPAGFSGNPRATPRCTRAQFAAVIGDNGQGNLPAYKLCPAASQVGLARIWLANHSAPSPNAQGAVWNLVPSPGKIAQFGFVIATVPVTVDVSLDAAGNYRLVATSREISAGLFSVGAEVQLWGVPNDPSHDIDRYCGGAYGGRENFKPPCPVDEPLTPFLTNPTHCAGPETASILARSWQRDAWISGSAQAPALTGCDKLTFSPAMSVMPSAKTAGAPTGLSVDLDFPQDDDTATGLAPAQLRDVSVKLPEGMTVNPSSANGLQACTEAQIGFGNNDPATCPDGSKVGTVKVTTPVLEETLEGAVYVRTQASDDPASGDLVRLGLMIENAERGIRVKLPGRVHIDPSTGRLEARFADNPELPVERIELKLQDGPRAPLVVPAACGDNRVAASLSSWAGHKVDLAPAFDVTCVPGLGAFAPSFSSGTADPVAGASSPFGLRISKPDGNSDLNGLTLQMPKGLLANLKGNVGQRVGTARVAAGPGSSPFWLSGPVVLEGAYGDAPFSLRVTVPAVAGPFNLGEVVVRQKIYVDPETARVTVVSDPLPTIVKGVPVRLQHLVVDVDKPGFMINPTSCAASEVKGTLASVAGQTAAVTSRFQVGECASLGYEPELSMKMIGKGQTKDGSHPALHARLVPPANNANTKKTTVTLPLALALDPGNANGLCEPADAARNACPANSIVGSAQAESVLPDTLKGPVYFVRGERIENGKVRKTLPKLFIPLSANGVTVYVHASSDVDDDRLVTTFDNLPDAPFSSFDLNINGGEHGILAVSGANTCAVTNVAEAEFGGQNGKSYASKVTIGTPCALGIVKSSRTSTALKITVGGLGAGKVSASGKGVTKSSRSLTSATTATLSLKLSKATRRALSRGRDVKVKVKVAFTAKGTKKAKTATKTVVVHGSKKR